MTSRPKFISPVGALLSLALHALLISPAVLPYFGRTNLPTPAASLHHGTDSEDDVAMSVRFLEPRETAASASRHDDGATPAKLQPVHVAIPTTPLPAFPTAAEIDDPHSSGDQAIDLTQRELLGRYFGQINARVSRAWSRPRTRLAEGRFTCQAKIDQNQNGDVLQIELQRCSADWRWQLSLVRAIQTASPLPAPSDPSVFTKSIVIQFVSNEFMPGGDTEGFEPATRENTPR